MNILQEIIGQMNKEEMRLFKLFINRTEVGYERKDARLFDFIRKNYPDYDEEKIFKKLYEAKDKNALYRLKNRLLEDIGKSLTVQYFSETDFNYIIFNITLGRLFYEKGQPKTAFYFLGKAEKSAASAESYDLLDLIYAEFIKLSHETLEINPEEYIKKRKANREQLSRVQQIDDILAALIYRIKVSQMFSGKDTKILDLLEKTINDFTNDKSLRKSPLLRFKMYHAISRILLQKQDYVSLEKYLLKTFDEFNKESLFTKNNHDTKLQMLTYLVNALFKNNKIETSLTYAARLKEAMEAHGKILHDKYLFFYYNSLVINYSVTNLDKAIEILNEAKENETIRKVPVQVAFIYGNLAVTYFDKGDFKNSLKNIVRLTMDDTYKHLDESFRLKICMAELVIRFELGDFEFLEKRTVQVKKDFASTLRKKQHQRDSEIIGIIREMIKSENIKKDKKLIKKINKFLEKHNEANTNDIIHYNSWLKSKNLK